MSAPAMVSRPVPSAAGRLDTRLAVNALGLATCAEWAAWVSVLVFAFDRAGAAGTGAASLTLLITAGVVTLVGGAIPDGPLPNRVFLALLIVETVGFGLAAVAAFADAPLWVILALVSSALAVVSLMRPTIAVVIPALVRTPIELVRANVWITGWEALAIIVGPLLASLALELAGPWAGFVVCSALALLAALLLVPLWRRRLPSGRPPGAAGSSPLAVLRQLGRVLRHGPTRALLVVIAGWDLVVGAVDILVVVIALDRLHLAESAPGWLVAIGGVGSVAGSLLANRLVGRPRLAPLLLLGSGTVAAAWMALSAGQTLLTLGAALVASGLGGALVMVASRILLQRVAPQDAIASLFSVAELVALGATALGALVVQTLIVTRGIEAALLGLGAIIGLATLTVLRPLLRIDKSADAPVVAIRLLRRTTLFEHLPAPSLEGVARAAEPRSYLPGERVITTGEPGDHYYVIVAGQADVVVDGVHRRVMGPDEGFGEIALLSEVPRTATVSAVGPLEVLRLERIDFLTAVTGHDSTRTAAWAVSDHYQDDDRRNGRE